MAPDVTWKYATVCIFSQTCGTTNCQYAQCLFLCIPLYTYHLNLLKKITPIYHLVQTKIDMIASQLRRTSNTVFCCTSEHSLSCCVSLIYSLCCFLVVRNRHLLFAETDYVIAFTQTRLFGFQSYVLQLYFGHYSCMFCSTPITLFVQKLIVNILLYIGI